MQIVSTEQVLKEVLAQHKAGQIGFVPTMGALHEGHLALIKQSKELAAITVCSIFVNPTQFNDINDFNKYPVTPQQDIALLQSVGCDILFLPSVEEIYPKGLQSKTTYELGFLENILEGKYRPNHFQGVCQVVERLLQIVMPNYLLMGAKDYQQCMVIKQLLHQVMPFKNIELVIVPTVREVSGLAKSSRNMRLSQDEADKATALYRTLYSVMGQLQPGGLNTVMHQAEERLLQVGFEKVDYVAVVDANTLELITEWDGKRKLVILAAAFINGVRLIDNIIMTE
jgi:pantoate--beta-alanine ligase